ncbi:Pro-FMRFamide-related neuropeptide VF [Clarias magur]|uniref:Pro-FMRFamide-related neuropeptide VF n=1 Tax=Clarias magur TaxID=1594786 RepID=A0A8J4U595_CLAMG|nr:Pro-FMRFamide-related neuropeptide VF [Clarias magur]
MLLNKGMLRVRGKLSRRRPGGDRREGLSHAITSVAPTDSRLVTQEISSPSSPGRLEPSDQKQHTL